MAEVEQAYIDEHGISTRKKSPYSMNLAAPQFDSCRPDSYCVLNSPRFRTRAKNIYQPVFLPKVAGYWLCKGAPGSPVAPGNRDIVLYYLHGGTYVEGHPASFLPLILRVAELAADRGITLSCFGLRYSYAPEAKYPTQLNQAVEGYKYLLNEEGISPEKIGVIGVSAGGHLSLCLLSLLPGMSLPKPDRGIFLMSPWLDLRCTIQLSFYKNCWYKDFIDRELVHGFAEDLFSSSEESDNCPHLNFTAPLAGGLSWKDVLPEKECMSAGGNEILLDEIIALKGILEKDGVEVDLQIKEGGQHVWQGVEDIWDAGKVMKIEERTLPVELQKGCRNVAEAGLKGVEGHEDGNLKG